MKAFVFILALLVAPQAVLLARRFESEKVFRVKLQNENQVNFLKELASTIQLDFWHPDSVHHLVAGADVDLRVSSNHTTNVQTIMEQNEMPYKILFHNLQEAIEKQFDGGSHFRAKYRYTRYNDWGKIAAWTKRMAEKYSKLVSRMEIGKTYEKNPIYLLKVGKESGKKRAIFMECGIHAREWASPAFCQWFVKQAVRTYGNDKVMTNLLDNMNFYVLPVFNIDGYIWTWTEDRMWRKNRSLLPNSTSSDCIGTDLNRNFRVAWGTNVFSHESCLEIFCGPSAESEPETKALTKFVQDHLSVIKGYISIHSYSQLLMFPYAHTYKKAPNYDELNTLAKEAVHALSSLYGTKYEYGPIASTIYTCYGSSIDWFYDEGVKYSFAFELRDTGEHGFLLPESKIRPTCKETMLAVLHIAQHILASAP
ncbi:mast cell carboxypeptidase A-like [Tiliqua scincoides]|uniref:mast cell carboxypeptidase A-like n=1 Tax=Tiliqua scincoides TaxID=71010 RepID=UPI003461B4DB